MKQTVPCNGNEIWALAKEEDVLETTNGQSQTFDWKS